MFPDPSVRGSLVRVTKPLRCADWALAMSVDPVGTAGRHIGYLLVEWPLPWPPDVNEIAELTEVHQAIRRMGVRMQTVCATDGAAHDQARIVIYRQPFDDGWHRPHVGIERTVEPAHIAAQALDLVMTFDGDPVRGTDVLICGHGRRDVCCGSKGTALAAKLGRIPDALGDGVRLWRTSHLGGHRFAPTALVLPDATSWAFLDATALTQIVTRAAPPSGFSGCYRGCTGLANAPAQAVERAVLCEAGWRVLDRPRRAIQALGGEVTFEIREANGSLSAWRAIVTEGRRLPVASCGTPADRVEEAAEMLVGSFEPLTT
jgi:hypothetical protein